VFYNQSLQVSAVFANSITSYSTVIDIQIEGITPDDIGHPRGFPVNSTAAVLVWDTAEGKNAPEVGF